MNWYKLAQEDSSQFEWHHDAEEVFDFVMKRFDVAKAKEIISRKPREIGNMMLEGLDSLIPKRPVPSKDRPSSYTLTPGVTVDWENIDKESVDLSIPVIVVTNPDGSYFPIDGWHRMAKALDKGVMSVPAVLLDQEESAQVRI